MDFSWRGKIVLIEQRKIFIWMKGSQSFVHTLAQWKTFLNPVGAANCTLPKLSHALLNSPQGGWAVTFLMQLPALKLEELPFSEASPSPTPPVTAESPWEDAMGTEAPRDAFFVESYSTLSPWRPELPRSIHWLSPKQITWLITNQNIIK